MANHYTVTVELKNEGIAFLRRELDRTDKRSAVRHARDLFAAILLGKRRAMVRACIATVAASQTVACVQASAVDATDTLTIAGTVLTAKTVPTTSSQFAIATTNATYAAAIAACINAHPTLQKIVRASSSGGTLTITCIYPGPIGNLVLLAEAGNSLTLGAAALAGGASDEVDNYQLGYTPAA